MDKQYSQMFSSCYYEQDRKGGIYKSNMKPDFEKFGMEKYDEVHVNLYRKYVLDAAMIMKIPVYWNKEKYYSKHFGTM